MRWTLMPHASRRCINNAGNNTVISSRFRPGIDVAHLAAIDWNIVIAAPRLQAITERPHSAFYVRLIRIHMPLVNDLLIGKKAHRPIHQRIGVSPIRCARYQNMVRQPLPHRVVIRLAILPIIIIGHVRIFVDCANDKVLWIKVTCGNLLGISLNVAKRTTVLNVARLNHILRINMHRHANGNSSGNGV